MANENDPLVLVFSPREDLRRLLAAGLLNSNFRIVEASTSYIAGIKANQYIPDVVVVDVAMKNVRDFLFLTRLERSTRTKSIPVIIAATPEVHAGLDSIRDEVKSGGEGGRDSNVHILEYPFQLKDLVDKIDSVLVIPAQERARRIKSDLVPSIKRNDIIGKRLFNLQIPNETKFIEIDEATEKNWAFPFAIIRALDIMGDDSSCCKELAKCIEADPGAAAAILKVANTVYYTKTTGRTSTISEAIVRIGFCETRSILASLSLITISSHIRQKYGFRRGEFWIHSLATGIAAEMLAVQVGASRPQIAFLTGLIHDIGKIPLDMTFEDVFPKLLEETTNRIAPFYAVERLTMGFSHADLGSHLAAQWNFPAVITSAILHHHDAASILATILPFDKTIEEAVYVANIITKAIGLGHSCDEALQEIPQPILADLKIEKGISHDFQEKLSKRFAQFWEYLHLSNEEAGVQSRMRFEKDYEVLIVYGPAVNFHPIEIALVNDGYTIHTAKAFPHEVSPKIKVVISIPDRGSPLDLTISADEQAPAAEPPYLRIFFLDGYEMREPQDDFARSNFVVMERRNLDFRLLLHVIEDYYFATSM